MLDGSHAGPVPDPCEFHGDHNLGYPMEHSKEAPIFCSSISSMEPATVPGFRPSSPPSHTFSSYPQSITTELNSAPTYGFLNQTLGLLKQFPSAATLTSPSSRGEAFENYQGIGQEQTLQSVMADNEQTLQSISDILQCQNSEDEYLRAMLTIIIFKVLNSYAAVLRCTPRFDGGPHWNKNHVDRTPAGVAGGYDAHGKDHGRMVAQQILHEVHRIQQLVNVLTERFSPHRGRVEPLVSSSSSSSTDRPDMFWDRERLSPLPGSLLEQIEIDLRRRLRNLLAEIVDILH
ncbi:hypothetical protein BDV28DRAFT_135597 [Aspergillus coremiiformis]|uniref:Aflatoxin regulatory protein domain-containing protein n=1 Tax=Aspergillus coremiiformis TaxID=138285 RepID=A0A5N6Z434_9EURO|nr:hypothetical protein BDV28DRAFT_135597 [Aspergillus coremiiformis]